MTNVNQAPTGTNLVCNVGSAISAIERVFARQATTPQVHARTPDTWFRTGHQWEDYEPGEYDVMLPHLTIWEDIDLLREAVAELEQEGYEFVAIFDYRLNGKIGTVVRTGCAKSAVQLKLQIG